MKKQPKFFLPLNRPVIVVGEKMGRQRAGEDRFALEGNGTGDFVHEAIGDKTNIILTNIVNYYYEGNFDHKKKDLICEGILDLIHLIEFYSPKKIICLGNIAADYMRSIKTTIPIIEMRHPSWVNRFQRKHRDQYIKQLSNELEERISADT